MRYGVCTNMIVHVHTARITGRTHPQIVTDPLRRIFQNLAQTGYNARVSIEAVSTDLDRDLPRTLDILKNLTR